MYTKKWKQETFLIHLFLSFLLLPSSSSSFLFLKRTSFLFLAPPSTRTTNLPIISAFLALQTDPLLSNTNSTVDQSHEEIISATMTSSSSFSSPSSSPPKDDNHGTTTNTTTTLEILIDRLPIDEISNKETSLNSFVTSTTTASSVTDSSISDEGKSLKETLVSKTIPLPLLLLIGTI